MYSKEIMNVITMNHKYEYCIVNRNHKILNYSESLFKYCDVGLLNGSTLNLFDVVPELVGMEDALEDILNRTSLELCIPLIFKEPAFYVNICVYHSKHLDTMIVLFENITEITNTQQHLAQAHRENLLLMDEIKQKNKLLETYNKEMQRLVDEEVAKNKEKQYMMELQTRHAQMGEMIAMITHQWKQPLSTIHAAGSLLKIKYALGTLNKNLFDEKMNNLLSQATYLNQTVDDFQKFFMPSKEKGLFEIKETISSMLFLVQAEYALHNINIVVTGETSVDIQGYANQYTQVILAILQNAKDALILSKQEDKQITIDIQRRNKRSLVSIHDNAGGIPEETIINVFTRYVTTKEKGSGLGLYIAKSMIEESMEGKLWVENKEQGAMFFIAV